MKQNDFFCFDEAKSLNFQKVPYTKEKELVYKSDHLNYIRFQQCHSLEKQMSVVSYIKEKRTRGKLESAPKVVSPLPRVPSLKHPNSLSQEKINDLKAMFPYMPSIDVEYMQSVIMAVPSQTKKNLKNPVKRYSIMSSPESCLC